MNGSLLTCARCARPGSAHDSQRTLNAWRARNTLFLPMAAGLGFRPKAYHPILVREETTR